MKQYFAFENQEQQVQLTVIAQMSYKYDAMSIQISKVKDPDTNEIRFVYEEIDNTEDSVKYCRYMGEDNIRNNYPWAVTMLPCKPLTVKQKQLMNLIHEYMSEVDDRDTVVIDDFVEYVTADEDNGYTVRGVEGLLSSLWVKGYIRCNIVIGAGVRYFELEPFGQEYMKSLSVEENENEEADEEDEEC